LAVNELSYTAAFEQVENGWIQARIVEVPGVITVGPSFMESDRDEPPSNDREQLRIELLVPGEH